MQTYSNIPKDNQHTQNDFNIQNHTNNYHSYPIIQTDLMFYIDIYIHVTNNPAIKKLLSFEPIKLE